MTGSLTHDAGRPRQSEAIDLVLGLDFGTSSSKVVVRTPFAAGRRAVAVPFSAASGSIKDYLIASKVTVAPNHRLSIHEPFARPAVWGLKERLRQDPTNTNAQAAVAGYLSIVIRESRTWYLRSESDVIGTRAPRWSMNLGIPSAGYDDAAARSAFLDAAKAAWLLADQEPVTLDDCIVALDLVHGDDVGAAVAVVPEVAAEAVGYAKSEQRQEGLYFMVDVGAATLDVCGFRLHSRGGEDDYNLLTAEVQPLGAGKLHETRMRTLTQRHLAIRSELAEADTWELENVPEECCDYLARAGGADSVKDVDADFLARCAGALRRVVFEVRKRRDPLAREWQDGVRVFLCGGGSAIRLYSEAIEEAHRLFKKTLAISRLRRNPLPLPSDLDSPIAPGDFHRIAVAYGLSYDSFDIGNVVPPSEIEDIDEPPVRNWQDNYISKEMV